MSDAPESLNVSSTMSNLGLCIGGPMDGQFFACSAPKFQIYTQPLTAATDTLDQPRPSPSDVRVDWYLWHKPGLWLIEGVSPKWALTHMAERVGFEHLIGRYARILDDDKEIRYV